MSLSPLTVAATAAAAVATALHLRAEYRGPRWQVYVCKPLSTTILLLLAALSSSAQGARYQAAIAIGLVCSLLGDIFLMLPRDRFIAGLACFLVAHFSYIVAFTAGVPFGTAPAILVPLLVAAIPILRLLWPDLGSLRVPVLLYAAAILLMTWSAWGRAAQLGSAGTALAGFGATLFMVSDAVLALNRFHRPFHQAEGLIIVTYLGAQALIALSVSVP